MYNDGTPEITSGYENAPSTRMLATHCCVCGRPLRDAFSVEIGMGPTCRKTHGYDEEVLLLGEEARKAANKIIHQIAAVRDDERERAAGISALRLLGFRKLPGRIEYRGQDAPAPEPVAMRLSSRGTGWYVRAPYKPAATAAWRSIDGRRWDGEAKENFVPWTGREALWSLLRTHYAGHVLRFPDGHACATTTIPAIAS